MDSARGRKSWADAISAQSGRSEDMGSRYEACVSWAQPPARMQTDWQDYRETELFLGEALSTGQERDHQWGEQLREADWEVE